MGCFPWRGDPDHQLSPCPAVLVLPFPWIVLISYSGKRDKRVLSLFRLYPPTSLPETGLLFTGKGFIYPWRGQGFILALSRYRAGLPPGAGIGAAVI
jgi:hypothetical protein